MTDWLARNAEWVLSGIGVVIPIAIISWIFTKKSISRKQVQKSGSNSINIQVGKNLTIGQVEPKDSSDEE